MSLTDYFEDLDRKLAPLRNAEAKKRELAKRWEEAATRFVDEAVPILEYAKKQLTPCGLKVECSVGTRCFSFAIVYPTGGRVGFKFAQHTLRDDYFFVSIGPQEHGHPQEGDAEGRKAIEQVCSVPLLEEHIKRCIDEYVRNAATRTNSI
jgi:hypothetical protein